MKSSSQRCGTTVVEFAIVASVTILLVGSLLVGGLGVFRYHEIAHLAREGARYAATHGGQYTADGIPQQTRVSAISSSADLRTYLLPRASLLEPDHLEVAVSWSPPSGATPVNMPTYVDTNSNLSPPGQQIIRNQVTVTITYQWLPELYLVGPITLTSTARMNMSY